MIGERVYGALLRLYPSPFREEGACELLDHFRLLRGEARHAGVVGVLRLWAFLGADLVRSVIRERVSEGAARRAARRSADPYPPPYGEACVAGLAVWTLYVATLAPTAAFWDAGEYITAAHILGIPHAPGNPLFVVLARSWELFLLPLGVSPAVAVNLFSATLSALAHVFWFLVADRALAAGGGDRALRRVGAWAAVALSATAYTVWSQSNVNEKVYTVSLLTVALVSWIAFRWRDRGRGPRPLLLAAYLLVLSSTNHLMGLLAGPALLLFVLTVEARALRARSLWAAALPLAGLALTMQFFLPIRAEQKPLVLEAEPACESVTGAVASVYTWGGAGCEALSSSLRREQYGKPPITADPTDPALPRGPALFGAQLLHYVQYLDWQWARSVAGGEPVLGGVRPAVTLLFLILAFAGMRHHWRRDRAGAAYLVALLVTLSLGLVVYLNFKYGWSIARDRFPLSDDHEVRERDYFFLIGFSLWGVYAGIGLAAAWRWLAGRIEASARLAGRAGPAILAPRALAAPLLLVAVLPLALNWSWASRAGDWTARDWAYNVLMSVEPYGILVTNGDNDSFPLWYVQKVEGIREDVTIVLTPYLNTDWYARQLRELTAPCPPGVAAADHPTRIVCQRAFDRSELPAALVRAGVGEGIEAPDDTILPLTDDEIQTIAGTAYLAPRDLRLRAGGIDTVVPAGTTILPQDTFITALLQANLGQRPVHFMAPSPSIGKLGLDDYAVRQGLTFRIDAAPRAGPDTGLVRLPGSAAASLGAWVDLPRTDTLLEDVYVRRGRLLEDDAPWTDPSTTTIPLHYVYAHYAAAQAHVMRDEEPEVARHLAHAREWERIASP